MKLTRGIFIVAILGLVAGPAFAAVNGTHHDVSPTGFNTQTKGTCYFCHGARDTSSVSGYGTIGALCVSRCHGGNLAGVAFGGATAQLVPSIAPIVAADNSETGRVATNLTALTAGHGLLKANLKTRINASSSGILTGVALPYTGGSETSIECTSCHNVHDSTNVPFLHGPLATPGAVSFCERCHNSNEGRGNSWHGQSGLAGAAANGEHPVNFGLVLTDVKRTGSGRIGRYIQFDDSTNFDIFDWDMTDAGADGNINSNAVHYLTGGKVPHSDGIGMGEAAAGGLFGCYTCHVTHLPGTANNLVACNTVGTVSGTGTYNPLCTRCHGAANMAGNINEWNPGLSDAASGNNRTTYGHPNGAASNAGTQVGTTDEWTYNTAGASNFTYNVDLAVVTNFASVPKGGVGYDTSNGKIYCTSCHDVHGGDNDTMAIADLDGTYNGAAAASVCYYCHTSTGIVDKTDNDGVAAANREGANVHHPTSDSVNTDADGGALVIDAPSWSSAAQANGDTFGVLTDGLQCPDCHAGGNARGTAHNW